jgi:site-specific DNA recombinase
MALPASQPDTRPWPIYARLSKAETGDLEHVDHQVKLCQDYAEARGIPTDPSLIFKDPSLSAWKKRVRRREWDALMALAADGAVPGILIYAVDRFTRRPKDLEALIELADDHGMLIEGPRSGRLDLSTATGRQQARWMAMQAASESDNTSERVKAGLAREMGKGKPMGAGRSFGFEVGGMVQRPEEAEVIREVAKKLLDGVAAATIAAELNAKGVRTSRGGWFTSANLIRMVSRPRNGGHILHRGEVIGAIRTPTKFDAKGKVVETTDSEPILDKDTYDAVQALIATRRRGRRPTGRFLLTGLLHCSECERPMNGATRHKSGVRVYRCPPQLGGCGRSIDAKHLEEMVAAYMVALESDPKRKAKITKREQALSDARARQLADVEALEEQLADLEVKKAMGEIIQRAYDRAKPVLDRRLKVAQDVLDGIAVPTSRVTLDPAADWADEDMTPEKKRALITRYKATITIKPFKAGVRRFDPARVVISDPSRRAQR